MNQWSKKLNFTWDVHQDKDWGMVPKSGWYSNSFLIDRLSVCLSRSKYFHLIFSFCFPFLILLHFVFQLFIFQFDFLISFSLILHSLFTCFAFHLLTSMSSYLQLLFMYVFLFLFLFLFSFFLLLNN